MLCGQITSMGARAAATLSDTTEWRVVALFARSLYLSHGGAFICVGDASIGDGPLNAIVTGFDQVRDDLQLDSVVRSAGNCLLFSDGSYVTWKNTAVWTMPPWPARKDYSPLSTSHLQTLFAASPTVGLFRQAASQLLGTDLPATTWFDVGVQRTLGVLVEGIVAAPPQRDAHLNAAARALIGLGPGLTPSGDDLLAGALLGLHATGHLALANQLGADVAAACIDGTSPLSAAFLRCAIAGETSGALHQVFSTALTNADWPAALDTLASIGHTSGWDHLAGFLLTLNAVQSRTK